MLSCSRAAGQQTTRRELAWEFPCGKKREDMPRVGASSRLAGVSQAGEAAGNLGDSFGRWVTRERSLRLAWRVGRGRTDQGDVAKLNHHVRAGAFKEVLPWDFRWLLSLVAGCPINYLPIFFQPNQF